ncbi:glycoside hydrolase domain-containing protein [Microtetraspora sp. NBRC 13810]|uniref:glycoside hydrolase domain-containing protein n=1 Tax=Microtetraspora sp. NBRC 13810 TaxID=3030990 RepID=UPI002552D9D6|nr:glycoside hydrolase domain-containing protein [Microtetraspora sp. NBRC 13810]
MKILQHGLFCKGYWGGLQDGNYDPQTITSVQTLKANMGLGPNGYVQPKIFKAILTMDAYTLVTGGSEKVRSVQQWLNGRYTNRTSFFIIPSDGIFSRDVQKALYLAIQFELGMTDDQATGVFGPGTQAGLRSHPLSTGSSGIWVQLFSAAAVFNGKAKFLGSDGYKYEEASFSTAFNSALSGYVSAFQSFSELPVTGNVDFATWCQALVSTGDPNRPGTAADCITTVTDARAAALRAAEYKIVGRYLDERSSSTPLNKQIQPGELDTIFRNGLSVFPISQYYGGEVGYFTYTQGYADALGAHAAAVRYGFDAGTVIYFAVDYDATQLEIESHIIPYFRGVVAGLLSQGKRYVHGVYGSRNVCIEVTKFTYSRWSFVSGMSTGFSGNMGFPLPENWSFNQIQTIRVGAGGGAIEIDKNIHKAGTDYGVSSVNNPSSSLNAFIAYIERIYGLALSYSSNRSPSQLVVEFLRHEEYNNFEWQQLIGGVDEGFVRHVKNAGIVMIRHVRDPFYGIDLNVAHLGATCNGLYVSSPPAHPLSVISAGDVTGWAGDLMTFYGEWRRDVDAYPSGHTYCMEKLAKVSDAGTFKLRDLIEDADGHNLAKMLRAGTHIVEAMDVYYQNNGYLSRFGHFFADRFETVTTGRVVANLALTDNNLPIIAAGRIYLINSTGGWPTLLPSALPTAELDEFVNGFVDTLEAKVAEEEFRLRKLRAEGKI